MYVQAQGTKNPALYSTLFITSEPHWIHSQPEELQREEILHCDFKFQHTEEWVKSQVCLANGGLVVKLEKPKRALTPGQYAVFYRDQQCLGSARIVNSAASDFSLHYLDNGTLKVAKELVESSGSESADSKRVNNLGKNGNKIASSQ